MKRIFFTLFPVMVLASSCKEVYLPEDLESVEKKVPVIEGLICENKNPEVKLSWAVAYEHSGFYPISGAEVTITENDTTIVLDETTDGIYKNVEYTGIRGRTYILHVVLPDESEYISSPQKILSPPEIDTLFASPGLQTTYTYNYYGVPLEVVNTGLYLFSDLSSISAQKMYFRFRTKVLKEYHEGSFIRIYSWEISFPDGAHSVDYTLPKAGLEVLSGYEPGFLKQYPGEEGQNIIGWILTFKVYSINQDVYDYYHSIKGMLSSDYQIFSPMPTQIKSNIHCVTEPGKAVAGVFEGSSVTTKYQVFAWDNIHSYRSWELDTFPDVNSAGKSLDPPYFWIEM